MPPKSKTTGKGKGKAAGDPKTGPLRKVSGNAVKKPATRTSTAKSSKDGKKAPTAEATTVVEKEATERVNYLLYCRLDGTENPTITRQLSVPSTLKLDRLHAVLQVAFGWMSTHMYAFRVEQFEEDSYGFPRTLLHVTSNMLGFENDPKTKEANDITLADVFESEFEGAVGLVYAYDMGDSWEHSIAFLGRESSTARKVMMVDDHFPAICLGGEGHPCIEDSGGVNRFEAMKEILSKPKSRDPEGWRKWYQRSTGATKPFNPYDWDILDVNHELAELAARPDFL